MYIEAILRDIDADEARLLGSVFHDPSLQMRARLAAQATVRVPDGTAGWGAWLWNGLVHPRQTRAPIQRQPPSQLTRRQRQDTRQSLCSGRGVKPRFTNVTLARRRGRVPATQPHAPTPRGNH